MNKKLGIIYLILISSWYEQGSKYKGNKHIKDRVWTLRMFNWLIDDGGAGGCL